MAAGLLESIDRSTRLAGHNRLALLLFRLDERQIFGINVLKVQEVLPRPVLTHAPSAHPFVAGVADIRGAVIPIIDMAKALGLPHDAGAVHVIVSEFSRSTQGFLVRAVERIVHVDVEKVLPPPADNHDLQYLTAVTQLGSQLVEIIDVERILAEIVGEVSLVTAGAVDVAQVRAAMGARRVLVADDSRVARGQIERVLGHLGIACTLVNDGRAALRHLQELAAQPGRLEDKLLMLISDVEMPDMDGYRLTTEIRRDPRLASLFVMLHTSLSGGFNQAMVKKVGADLFLAKINADELGRAVLERLKMAGAA